MINDGKISEPISDIDLKFSKAEGEAAYPNIKNTFILFFIFLINEFVAIILTGIIWGTLEFKSPAVKFLLYVLPLLFTIRYATRKRKEQGNFLLKINFNKIQGWVIPLLIIGALAITILLAQISAWMSMPESVRKIFEKVFSRDPLSIVTIVLVAPILEEILCRGIVLRGLLKNYSPFTAILISAFFFGALHLNPWQGIPAFLDGLFLGWVYFKTQSVIPGMIVHATINISATLVLFLPHPQQSLLNLFSPYYYMLALTASALIFAAICMVIQRKVRVI